MRTITFRQYERTEGTVTVTLPGPYHDLDEMETANKRAGYHYFSQGAMRAFKSRPYPGVFEGRFFIDSTKFVSSKGESKPRRYAIRALLDDGRTSSVVLENTQDWPSLDSAKRAIARALKGEKCA